MYCFNCGHTFSEYEIVQKCDGETCTITYCCPRCGVDDIEETTPCVVCGKEQIEDDIASGYCIRCLWDAIDYETALEWMKQGEGWLADFMLNDWFGAGMKGDSSKDLDALLEETFRRIVADEKLSCALSRVQTPRFLEYCRAFCLPHYPADFGSDGREFAEWYAERQKGEKNDR